MPQRHKWKKQQQKNRSSGQDQFISLFNIFYIQGGPSPDLTTRIYLTSYREFTHPCGITVIKAKAQVIAEDRGNWFTTHFKVIEFCLGNDII